MTRIAFMQQLTVIHLQLHILMMNMYMLLYIGNDEQIEKFKVTKEDLKEDYETTQMLMYFPWDTDEKTCVWVNKRQTVIPMM